MDFLNWIAENWKFCVFFVLALVLFFRTGNMKYLKEFSNMFYRKLEEKEPVTQDFDRYKPVYRLNKQTGELELTDDVVDIQELVNSCKDVCLQTCLERFMPTEADTELQDTYEDMIDDLDLMAEYRERLEGYREYFQAPDADDLEIQRLVQQEADSLKQRLAVKENIKNGGVQNGEVSETVSKDEEK